eukprot:723704-Hanusia_phi.AAC.5
MDNDGGGDDCDGSGRRGGRASNGASVPLTLLSVQSDPVHFRSFPANTYLGSRDSASAFPIFSAPTTGNMRFRRGEERRGEEKYRGRESRARQEEEEGGGGRRRGWRQEWKECALQRGA